MAEFPSILESKGHRFKSNALKFRLCLTQNWMKLTYLQAKTGPLSSPMIGRSVSTRAVW